MAKSRGGHVNARVFARGWMLEGLSKKEAARKAGSRNPASWANASTLNRKVWREEARILRALERAGLKDDDIARGLAEGRYACRVETDAKGKLRETELADHAVRHKFLETICKLKRHFPDGAPPPTNNTQVNILYGHVTEPLPVPPPEADAAA